jgi:hypothetical protein
MIMDKAVILTRYRDVEDRDDMFSSVLEAAGGHSIAIGSAHRQNLRVFAPFCAIQSFIDALILNGVLKFRWRISLIVFGSCQRLSATFPQSSNSLLRISVISYFVAMH